MSPPSDSRKSYSFHIRILHSQNGNAVPFSKYIKLAECIVGAGHGINHAAFTLPWLSFCLAVLNQINDEEAFCCFFYWVEWNVTSWTGSDIFLACVTFPTTLLLPLSR